MNSPKLISKKYEVKIIVEVKDKTTAEGLQEVKEMMKNLCLKVSDIKPVISLRTDQQNRALHKFFQLLAQELTEKHIDKREFFKEPFFMSWTPSGIKEEVWKPLQKSLTGKKSTTKLDKTEEINLIYDNLNKILIDKYNGEVIIPEFPNYELLDNYLK